MYKNLKISTVESLENENYHMYRKLFPGEHHFFIWNPSARKLQDLDQEANRIKSKKINRTLKLCTLATNNLILS